MQAKVNGSEVQEAESIFLTVVTGQAPGTARAYQTGPSGGRCRGEVPKGVGLERLRYASSREGSGGLREGDARRSGS